LVAFSLIGSDTQRPADVIENNRHVWKGARQLHELQKLRMIDPGIEAQAVVRQAGESPAESAIRQQTWPGVASDSLTFIPRGRVADATEKVGTSRQGRPGHLGPC